MIDLDALQAAVDALAPLRQRKLELLHALDESDMLGLECSETVQLEWVNGEIARVSFLLTQYAPVLLSLCREQANRIADLEHDLANARTANRLFEASSKEDK